MRLTTVERCHSCISPKHREEDRSEQYLGFFQNNFSISCGEMQALSGGDLVFGDLGFGQLLFQVS